MKPDITYSELLKRNKTAGHHSWLATVAVVQNINLEPYFGDCLRYSLNDWGGDIQCRFSEPAAYYEGCTTLLSSANHTLVCLDLEHMCPALLHPRFDALKYETDLQEQSGLITGQLRLLAERIAQSTHNPVFWLGFCNRYEISGGELLAENRWNTTAAALNEFIQSLLRPGWYFLDLNALVFQTGAKHFFDRQMGYAADMPFSFAGTLAIAEQTARYIRGCKGLTKKCIVLDCDNTLWGGVLSEDDFDRIALGELYPGRAYQDFQRELLKLWGSGVLLALCSKNDADSVWDVFDRHPDMLLKREHIAAARINWNTKSENLRELSEELGIGLSGMVLVDDSPAEHLEVSISLPEVAHLRLEARKPHLHAELLQNCGFFDRLRRTEEDALRNQSYLAQRQRAEASKAAESGEAYLRTLATELTISLLRDLDLPRVVQLSQRATRFNAAGGPVSEAIFHAAGECFCLRAKDCFGDLGLVGFAILRAGEVPVIEAFTISCRALGRKIEDAFLEWCVHHAEKTEGTNDSVAFRFIPDIPNNRNQAVGGLLEQHGFVQRDEFWHRESGFPSQDYPIVIHEQEQGVSK